MQFVDKQNRISSPTDLVHDSLDTLFELSSVLGARDHHGKIQNDDSFFGQDVWDFSVDDPLSKALDNRGLSNPSFAQEHRVVLGPAAQDLGGSLDLALASDHRVELALPCQFGQITAKAIQGRGLALATLGGCS